MKLASVTAVFAAVLPLAGLANAVPVLNYRHEPALLQGRQSVPPEYIDLLKELLNSNQIDSEARVSRGGFNGRPGRPSQRIDPSNRRPSRPGRPSPPSDPNNGRPKRPGRPFQAS